MSLESISIILVIHTLALISPGPDFAVVTRLSISSSRRAGLWAAAGIATSIGVYVLICAFGLSIAIATLPVLTDVLTVLGASYLAWLGVQCLRSKGKLPESSSTSYSGKAFITGFFTNLLNPKAMLYFGSVLSQVLTPEMDHIYLFILCVSLVTESLLWFGLVSLLFSSKRMIQWVRHHLIWFDRTIGVVLIGLAAKIAFFTSR